MILTFLLGCLVGWMLTITIAREYIEKWAGDEKARECKNCRKRV